MAETTTAQIKNVGRIMVPVSDQDKAIEFYVDKLGFEKRADIPYGEGERWVEVAPAGGETALALVSPRDTFQPGGSTNISLSTDDADSAHADLRERGVDVDDEVMKMGGPVPPMFWFRDQDGNSLLIVEG